MAPLCQSESQLRSVLSAFSLGLCVACYSYGLVSFLIGYLPSSDTPPKVHRGCCYVPLGRLMDTLS